MPSFMSLRSRPATSGSTGNRRHSSVQADSPRNNDSNGSRTHKPKGSLQRLSLSLTNSGENLFGGLFTQDPEEMSIHRKSEDQQPQSQPRTQKVQPSTVHEQVTTSPNAPAPVPVPAVSSKENDSGRRERLVKPERFSLLKFRHASDPQLSTRYKATANPPSETFPPPMIITTAPTSHQLDEPVQKKPKKTVLGRSLSPFRKSTLIKERMDGTLGNELDVVKPEGASSTPDLGKQSKIHFDPFISKDNQPVMNDPPAYGDESSSALAIPVSRLSESGGSEGSSGDHKLYARTTTTISTTTTIFRLKKKKKDKGPLFPLPERFPHPRSERTSISNAGEGSRRSMSPGRRSNQAVRFEDESSGGISLSPTHSLTAITNAPLGSPGPAIVRKHSTLSAHSGNSTPSLLPPRLSARGRSSTMGSIGKSSERDGDITPQATASSRTSTSTSGRRSFGDLLMFSHRMRQNSVPPRHDSTNSPSTPGSKSNSMQISREAEPEIAYPAREESDTPATYLEKLEAAVQRGSLATILCKTEDDFAKTCLRKYMRGFSYFGESIDMAIRKMLMEVELPKETQQIDRLLGGFADRYHECNPGIFVSTDEASIVAFSILLLHSDNHNKNNKRKMQRQDYVKNTHHGRVSVSSDVLECFYDNICYTPFIHFEDEVAINSHRLAAPKLRKNLMRTKSSEVVVRGQVDPYTLILDNKIELLRAPLKDVMETEDTYSSTGTLRAPNSNDHHKAFLNSAVLQIISARSRPDAFTTQATTINPAEASAGLVSIKVAKVGLLWRKDPKKKKAKRPWQEWGAVLTDSKLYFFKDVGWIKKLTAQYEAHTKQTRRGGALIFKPPMTSFDPDALMAMDDAVALLDSSYKKHKNAFTFIKHGGFEEVFLANSEAEMNDWIGKLNYAATFRTAGVRLRAQLGTPYEGKYLLRKDSELSMRSTEVPVGENSVVAPKGVDPHMAWEIMFYRRQLIGEKISNLDDKLAVAQKELDQLLRNARHLMILLPIQARTREALVLAAGRMTAKLKWTRVDIWRNKTHRDILIKDLEAEANTAFPQPVIKTPIETPKATPKRASQQTVQRNDVDASTVALSPTLSRNPSTRRLSQTILEHIKTSDIAPEDQLTSSPSQGRLMTPSPKTSPVAMKEELSPNRDVYPDSPLLQHKPSVVSSHRSRQEEEILNAVQGDDGDDEERILIEAGLASVEGDVHDDSDNDKVGTISSSAPESPSSREHRASVRRSLQRTLREGPHIHRLSSHHQRKGKESSASVVTSDDRKDSGGTDGQELKRGTGSFILHGKKASVITMSSEWQSMTHEERMKRMPLPTEEETEKDQETEILNSTADVEVERTPRQSASSVTPLASPDKEAFHSAPSSRRSSISDSFTDSEGGLDVNQVRP